jgi:hypothetical protein
MTQRRVTYFFKKPKLLANGKYTVNTAKVELAHDIECSQADIQDLADCAAQMAFSSDFIPTTKLGSLS